MGINNETLGLYVLEKRSLSADIQKTHSITAKSSPLLRKQTSLDILRNVLLHSMALDRIRLESWLLILAKKMLSGCLIHGIRTRKPMWIGYEVS